LLTRNYTNGLVQSVATSQSGRAGTAIAREAAE
jgi:hypothetical protein